MKNSMKNSIRVSAVLLAFLFTANVHSPNVKKLFGLLMALKERRQRKAKFFMRMLKCKTIQASLPPLNWLLKNVPNFHSSLYINAADIYDELAEKEKDPARKKYISIL